MIMLVVVIMVLMMMVVLMFVVMRMWRGKGSETGWSVGGVGGV